MYQDAVKQLADAANVPVDHVFAIIGEFLPDDAHLTLPAPNPSVHANFGIVVASSPYLANTVFDDQVKFGYNFDTTILSEPVEGIVFEVDYPVTVRGVTNIRTMENYKTIQAFVAAPTESRTDFVSYCPDHEHSGANPFINYTYTMFGDGYMQTPGGGGHSWYRGSDPTLTDGISATVGGIDYDGFKLGNVTCIVDAYLNITAVTAANPMVVTLNSVSDLRPGSNLEFWSVDAASITNRGFTRLAALTNTEVKIVSISGNAVTTDYNNTGGAVTTAHKCKKPNPLANSYQGTFSKLSAGRTIPANSTDIFSVAGPVSFYSSSIHFNDTNAAPSQLQFTKLNNNTYQIFEFFQTAGSDIGFGFLSTSPGQAYLGWGPYQATDANFNQANSYFSVGPNGIAVGGTTAAADGRFRLAAGSAAQAQIQFEKQSDYTGTSSAVQMWAANSGDMKVRTSSATKTLASFASATSITGSRGGNVALANLLTALAANGWITDGTSA